MNYKVEPHGNKILKDMQAPADSSRILSKPLILILSVVAIVGFAMTFAGFVGSLRYLEITSDYRPHQLVLALCVLVAAFVMRRLKVWRKITLFAILCAGMSVGVNGIEVLPILLSPAPKAQSVPGGRQFKAVAFNVEGANTRYAEARQFVLGESPDAVAFCEASGQWTNELRSLKQTFPHHLRINEMDIEIFSRHPIVRSQVFHFGPERGFVAAILDVQGVELSFVAVHTYARQWRGVEGFRLRTIALEEGLGKQTAALPRPLLIMGDFNAGKWSPAFKTMLRNSGLSDAQRGFGLVATHHGHGAVSKWLWRTIDHALHSADVTVNRFRAGPDLGSDHLPIVLECTLPSSAATGSASAQTNR